eukprot:6172727-Pleurochrysis_carterae.AAC.4
MAYSKGLKQEDVARYHLRSGQLIITNQAHASVVAHVGKYADVRRSMHMTAKVVHAFAKLVVMYSMRTSACATAAHA